MDRLKRFADDALLVAGCICILIGLAQISAAAAWVAGGVMLIGFGVLVGKANTNAIK